MQREWTVPVDHPAFVGHFRGQPILPGVVLLDQILIMASEAHGEQCWTIAQTKFLRPVGPGTPLKLTLSDRPNGSLGFEINTDGGVIAVGVLEKAPA